MEQIERKNNGDIRKIGIIGDGHFAEAIAYLISKVHKDVEIVLWTHKKEYEERAEKKGTFRHSKRKRWKYWFRQEVELLQNVHITNDESKVVEGADVLFSALPAQKTREVIEGKFKDLIKENWENIRAIISGTKGIERETHQRISQVLESIFSQEEISILEKYGVLSGLNFARDMIYNEPMVTNIVSQSKEVQSIGMDILLQEDFTVLPSTDVCGAEIVGAVKNVIAIAAGAAKGAGYSDSSIQGLIGAGIEEVERFALAFGADTRTFSGMKPTMRDLEGTATSRESRNRQEGFMLAKREKRDRETGIAEGVWTVDAVMALAQEKKIKMPVCEAVQEMIQKEKKIPQILRDLNKKLHDRAQRVADISREKVQNGGGVNGEKT